MAYYEKDDVTIRESCLGDIKALKDRLRKQDAEEVIAAGYTSVKDSLDHSYARSSVCLTVEFKGVPVAMFGIVPEAIVGATANIWFLGSDEMKFIKKTFVKLSREFIRHFLVQYPILWNAVDGRYESAIKWLKSCGAEFNDVPITVNGVNFYKFAIRRR